MTGELVQNNTLQLLSQGVIQTVTHVIDTMLGSDQSYNAVVFWVIVLVGAGFIYYLYKKTKRGY